MKNAKEYADRLSRAYWQATAALSETERKPASNGGTDSFEYAPALDVFLDIIGDLYRESAKAAEVSEVAKQ